jgi:hypothetical protein
MKAESIKAKLVSLSNRLDRDFNSLALEFVIERLVMRLQASQQLSSHLIFRGGFVMLKSYGSNRTTIDLDASLYGISIEDAEASVRSILSQDWQDGLWMGEIIGEDLKHQTEYAGRRLTIRFSFGKPQIDIKRLGKVILDIGIADKITPGPIESELNSLLGGESISWKIYPVESIIAEKLHAIVTHGNQNSRMKDIYDLVVLIPKCENQSLLKQAIIRTFEHRSTKMPSSFSNYWRTLDKTILKRSAGAVSPATGKIPEFNDLDEALDKLLLGIG